MIGVQKRISIGVLNHLEKKNGTSLQYNDTAGLINSPEEASGKISNQFRDKHISLPSRLLQFLWK